jgi:hypothetical protein
MRVCDIRCVGCVRKFKLLRGFVSAMSSSKRKEQAQEVEFVPIYNKRLRKSFIAARNVHKPSSHRQDALSEKRSPLPSSTGVYTPPAETPPAFSFTFDACADYDPIPTVNAKEHSRKSKRGKVLPLFKKILALSIVATFRLKIHFLKSGYPYERLTFRKSWD